MNQDVTLNGNVQRCGRLRQSGLNGLLLVGLNVFAESFIPFKVMRKQMVVRSPSGSCA